MKIEVFRNHFYGKFFYYPINNHAKMLVKMLGQKSLTDENIQVLKEFKCEIVIQNA